MSHVVSDAHETLTHIDDVVLPAVNRAAMVGLSLGVVQDGELVFAKGYGLADVARHRPVTPDTVFRIGSVAKTFTGIGVMQLVERGLLDLDVPVADVLRGFPFRQPPGARSATVRHLLTHTSGIGELRCLRDLRHGPTTGLGVPVGRPIPPLSAYYARGLRAELSPGRKWAYANHGYAVLGQIVEDITGRPFADYMREHVFRPLGMNSTDFLRTAAVTPDLAVGYAARRGRLRPVKDEEIVIGAAGSVFSSITEMARYAAALMNGGANRYGQIIKPETLASMFEPHWKPDPRLQFGQGLAFFVDEFGGHRVVWHDGAWPGFTSALLMAPEKRLAVIALANGSADGPRHLAEKVLRTLLGDDRSTANRSLPHPEVWADVIGVYAPEPGLLTNLRCWSMFAGELEILVREGALVARSPARPLRKGILLRPAGSADPLVFEGTVELRGNPVRLELAFDTGASGEAATVAGSMLRPFQFRRRPRLRSLRHSGRFAAVGLATAFAYRHYRLARREWAS